MLNKMKIFSFLILFLALSCFGSSKQKIYFYKKGNYYCIKFIIDTKCNKDLLLDILYDYSHMEKFMKETDYKIRMVKKGPDWYIYELKYSYFLYKSAISYLKKKSKEDYTVYFNLTNFDHNVGFVPKMVSAKGYFKIVENDNNTFRKVVYYQKAVLEDPVGSFYFSMAKKKARQYQIILGKYIKKHEQN